MKLLTVGPIWRGSNAGGLFKAMSRNGCIVDIIDEYYYLSFHASNIVTKIAQKCIRPLQVAEFNKAIISSINLFKPEILFVYKGAFVLPSTLEYARKKQLKLALFYPDVSMTAHGNYLTQCIPLYNIVFTTKTFGITDLGRIFGVKNAHFIPHGFDPEIHRKVNISEDHLRMFGCDASFIGTWSPKKEQWLSNLKEELPDIDLKIWGAQWSKATSSVLKSSIQNTAVLGDLYSIAIQCSKINLGILSEQVVGASSGDFITSRTFHIPGANGFLLHERNAESVVYFKEDVEAGFFNDPTELITKVKYYLSNDRLREQIKTAGYKKAWECHSLDARALNIINTISKNL